ncbi:unnamed protein product [Linum tenue]|uniref:Phospholipid/glycerol acyltransferase domain-containing protein n=1 Tax=Linum tenue TaxID=586396 RepID=A0AAV0JBR8_9ROSI|nr:unnamed protein product [Linum tenue]
MLQTAPFFVTFFLYIFRLLFRNPPPKPLRRSLSLSHPYAAVHSGTKTTYHKFSSLRRDDDPNPTTAVVIDVEGALLKSTSMFPYFMLVAFEAGSFVRAAVLLLFYPFLRLLTLAGGQGGELELKLMVFISFFGLTQKDFSVGSSVLPRAFLSDVALEAFEAAKGGGRGGGKVVAVCGKLPRVMVESFLKDYLEVEFVVARELRVVGGYFVGALEEDSGGSAGDVVRAIGGGGDGDDDRPVGIARFSRDLDDHCIFSLCKEIYLVRRADKASWRNLPREKYPKPLIFHDGRLAAVPTPLSFLALLVWTPFGLLLAAARLAVAITLPYTFSVPILYFSGFRTVITQTATSPPNSSAAAAAAQKKGQLYVCNHRTLLDPLYLSFTMNRKFTAVTYSLSRVSELLSPIPTVRLNRDRVRDAEMMDRLLGRGDLVVCPEGTTCREPYLLRFSPLFAELTDEVVPVAMDVHVDMFYGTTASGLKCLDPLFFLLNPRPEYCIRVLDPVSTGLRPGGNDGPSRYDVANRVQRRIGDALGFECTKLTRKDKYMALAGNEGIHYNP